MPAVPYPANPYPAVPLSPVRSGPGRTEAPDVNVSRDGGPADPGQGDPRIVSGPAGTAAPAAAVGPVGPGYNTRRFTVPSAPNTGHGIRPLADARQLHYNPPGQIPGPGGNYLIAPVAPRTVGPAPRSTAPVTLATVAAGLKPWASSMRGPA